jgi:hypothetical protein
MNPRRLFSRRRCGAYAIAIASVAGCSDHSVSGDAIAQAETAAGDGEDHAPSVHHDPQHVADTDRREPLTEPLPGGFLETFDGAPSAPEPFTSPRWDVTVHTRDKEFFEVLEPMEAHHGMDCSSPGNGPPPVSTHTTSSYSGAAFLCRDHMMTALDGSDYAMAYVTPNHLVDFSDGEAVISFEISTLRTSVRDWWDVWITPYEDNLQLPLDLGTDVDASGPPRRAVRVGLGTENQLEAEIYEDHEREKFDDYPKTKVPGKWWEGYETFLTPDAARREVVEIHISEDHLRVGMPEHDFWWIDSEIPELDWTTGVVQFGHHSYNPTKDCNETNNPSPKVEECAPNTWHWDTISIAPATPFSMVHSEQRTAEEGSPTITFEGPAPADAHLRFAAIGTDIEINDGSGWREATPQATEEETAEDHFASYWVEVPEGTTKVRFRGGEWYGGPWHVRDASIWSLTVDETAADETAAAAASDRS